MRVLAGEERFGGGGSDAGDAGHDDGGEGSDMNGLVDWKSGLRVWTAVLVAECLIEVGIVWRTVHRRPPNSSETRCPNWVCPPHQFEENATGNING
ncbi:hypothetical protein [Natrialba hulunbeirensis]|uniref:hypothetical protein n=1 Tax=Natrialba hulunbeirensis TaxID=123783 RepID=UPI00126867EB|nr:hypothetical protein [Natrialba hulunbeirensis]